MVLSISLSVIIHALVIISFSVKNISNKPITSMTVVNLVENVPSKLSNINKNTDFKVNENSKDLFNSKNKNFIQYEHIKNLISEREKIKEKKIKTSFSQQKQILRHNENQINDRYKKGLIFKKKTNSVSKNTKSSAKYKIGTIENPHPEYPMIARKKGWQGKLLLNVHVNKYGNVTNIKVVKTSGFEILDKTSVETLKNWKFIPARIGKKNIKDNLNIPVSFKLIN